MTTNHSPTKVFVVDGGPPSAKIASALARLAYICVIAAAEEECPPLSSKVNQPNVSSIENGWIPVFPVERPDVGKKQSGKLKWQSPYGPLKRYKK